MVSVIRPFMFANWYLVKLGSTPFREKERWGGGGVEWEGAVFLGNYISKGWLPGPGEGHS